ncbi:hypothetical protein NPX13_g2412 [Xylaria arbuscula]|uniref:Uncharacterized protein n=1 Tax=Xylaria arbuscula TaxID=114810 RepID=A0A9W8TP71_9PEZI|nr:hypothetical protein NPX13_g2412 [Xylaria arbuscula]
MAQPEFLANLQVDISQSTDSPHTLSVSVTNTHPSVPVTILKWNSPLDPAALGLGLLEIVPAGGTEPIQIQTIKISRLMPPKAESLVTLRPLESAMNTVELREPMVPSDIWSAGPAKVTMKGRWMAVWPEITEEDLLSDTEKLKSVGAGAGSLVGEWESGSVEIS